MIWFQEHHLLPQNSLRHHSSPWVLLRSVGTVHPLRGLDPRSLVPTAPSLWHSTEEEEEEAPGRCSSGNLPPVVPIVRALMNGSRYCPCIHSVQSEVENSKGGDVLERCRTSKEGKKWKASEEKE